MQMERAARDREFTCHVPQEESDAQWASVLRSQSERPGSSMGWQCRHAATANRPSIRIEPDTYPQVSQEINKE